MPVIFRNGRPVNVPDNDPSLARSTQARPARPIQRLTIVDRMTQAELEAAVAFFNGGTAEGTRARERWTAATEVNPRNPDTVRLFTALYGADRTAELLAPE